MKVFNSDNLGEIFQYSLFPFKKGILVSYKKTGTRFFMMLSSDSVKSGESQCKEIETHWYLTQEKTNDFIFVDNVYNQKMNIEVTLSDVPSFSSCYTDTADIFKKENVNNFNELLFDNKDNDIIFVIRNPFLRFASGLIQILLNLSGTLHEIPNILDSIYKHSDLNSDEIKNFTTNFITDVLHQEISVEMESILLKFTKYLIKHKFSYITSDVHTQNFLSYYPILINNITNKESIKIIDLEDCNSLKSLSFFNNLRDDELLKTIYNEDGFGKQMNSNKLFYTKIIELIESDSEMIEILSNYLKNEFLNYIILKDSPYFVELKD